jgi:hypothetical protein
MPWKVFLFNLFIQNSSGCGEDLLKERTTMKERIKFTMHKYRYLVLLTGILLLCLSQISMAQVVKPKPTPQVKPTPRVTQKKMVFKSKGVSLPPAERFVVMKKRSPGFLTEATRRLRATMAENGDTNTAAVTSYLTLSPRTPYVENKGFLQLLNSRAIRPGNDFADFSINQDWATNTFNSGAVEVWIKPAHAGQWLLADCTVWNRSGTFEVDQADRNKWSMDVTGEGHLEIFINAQDTNWQRFTISHVIASTSGLLDMTYRERSEKFQWHFYSCEVTATN